MGLHLKGDAIGKVSIGDSETLLSTIQRPLDGLALTDRRGSSSGRINSRGSSGGGVNGSRNRNEVSIIDEIV